MGTEAVWIPAVIAAAGVATSASQAHDAQASADNKSRAEGRRIRDATNLRNNNINQVREAFGIGSSGSAQANAGSIQDQIKKFYQTSLQANLGNADSQFAGASRTSRQNLARVGQLGSGLDTSTQSGNLSDYLKARQRAVVEASGARDRLQGSLASQRLGLESQIGGGSLANPDFGAIASQRDLTLSQANSNVAPAAIGNLFNTAGSTYFGGKVQEANGNQGMQAFNFSNRGGNRGKIN